MPADAVLAELIARHGPAVGRVAALYAWQRAEREDLVQEVWIAVVRAWPSFRGEASERTFVLRIAHNRGVTHSMRRRARGEAGDEGLEELPDPTPLPEEQLAREQQRRRLLAAIRRLPLPLREVAALRLEGLSDAEIASVVGISAGNVAVRLTRARHALRELLEGQTP